MEATLLEVAKDKASRKATELQTMIRRVYRYGIFSFRENRNTDGMGQNYGIFSKVVPGADRCKTLKSYLIKAGSDDKRTWRGDEEKLFHLKMHPSLLQEQQEAGAVEDSEKKGGMYAPRHALTGGILDLKYTLKSLADMGFNDLALEKASGK